MTFAYFVIIFMTSAVIAGLLLVVMVRKYYWGPTGLPPKQRYQAKDVEAGPAKLDESQSPRR
jgi:hypothetical protein